MSHPLTNFGRKYAATQWRWYLGGTLALIVTNIIVLEIPQLAKRVINALAASADLTPLSNVALVIILLGVGQIVIRSTSRIMVFWPGRTLEAAV